MVSQPSSVTFKSRFVVYIEHKHFLEINEETAFWDKLLPSCLQIFCPELPLVDFKGDRYCSDGRKYGSNCK